MRVQAPIAYGNQHIELKTPIKAVSSLVSVGKSIAKSFFSAGAKLATVGLSTCSKQGKPMDATVALTTQLLNQLNQKSPIARVLKPLIGAWAQSNTQRQAHKQLAANALKEAVMRSFGGSSLTLSQLKTRAYQIAQAHVPQPDLYPSDALTKATQTIVKQIHRYIDKAAPHALSWAQSQLSSANNLQVKIRQEVKQIQQKSDAIGLSWNEAKNGLDTHYHIQNQVGNVEQLNRDLLDSMLQEELNAVPFKTTDGTELIARGSFFQNKSAGWIEKQFPTLATALESSIHAEMQNQKSICSGLKMDWQDFIHTENLAGRLNERFTSYSESEIGAHLPDFVEKLVQLKLEAPENYIVFHTNTNNETIELNEPHFKEKGKEWRVSTFPAEAKKLDTHIHSTLQAWQKSSFETHSVPSHVEFKQKCAAFLVDLKKTNPFVANNPNVSSQLLNAALKSSSLFYFSENFSIAPSKFRGGYLKKAADSAMSATRVKAADGKVYELLNTLTDSDSIATRQQHGLNKYGKVTLGKGGFGKVRLARDVETGHIVAVKKFSFDENKLHKLPDVVANIEIEQFERLGQWGSSAPNPTLASMLDYAHVQVPKKNESGTVPKSYIFSPLANAGDGKQAIGNLMGLRIAKKHQAAQARFIQIAKGYAKAVMDMHALGFNHRDIKPANFLHTKNPSTGQEHIQLADFGSVQSKHTQPAYHGAGTVSYLPPEAETGNSTYNPETHDSFSLGVSLLLLKEAASGNKNLTWKFDGGATKPVNLRCVEKPIADGKTETRWVGVNVANEIGALPLDMTHPDNIIAKLLDSDAEFGRISAQEAFEALSKI